LAISWRLFAFGFLATGVTVLLFGFLPALRASDVDVAEPLKASAGTTTGQHRGRYSLLAVSQVALALVVLMAAAVLVRSAHRLATRAFGFDPQGLLNARVDLRGQQFGSARELDARFDNVRQTVHRFPGVKLVAMSSSAPTDGNVAISDFEGDSLNLMVLHGYQNVTPDYLRTYGARILEGRDFTAGDRQVAIVNQVAAATLWPRQSPIGRMLKLGHPRSNVPWIQVVGVSSNIQGYGGDPNLPPDPQVFVVPLLDTTTRRSVMIRADNENGLLQIQLAREIQAAAALKTPPRVTPWLWGYEETKTAMGFVTNLFGFIAICGLGLAAVGLYGVLAYAVNRRMREFAVRIALGAMAGDMFKLVMHDGTVMFLAGTGIGAFAAMGAAKWLDSLLYGIPFSDVVALVVSELVLCVVAFLACLAPARHAMRADPVEILRAT
jgi:putative ABC transport system permease protein